MLQGLRGASAYLHFLGSQGLAPPQLSTTVSQGSLSPSDCEELSSDLCPPFRGLRLIVQLTLEQCLATAL